MFETVMKALIGLVLLVIAVFVVIWVCAKIGIALPGIVIGLLWVIAALVALIVLYRILKAGGFV